MRLRVANRLAASDDHTWSAAEHKSLQLLCFDSLAGLAVGLVVLAFHDWLAQLYGVAPMLVLFIGTMNLVYASYSGVLALRARKRIRPSRLAIDALIAANFAWSMVCAALMAWAWSFASVFGLAALALECLFLLVLAAVETRYLRVLASRTESDE